MEKCKSWFGHKYEPRYSKSAVLMEVTKLAVAACNSTVGATDLMETSRAKTYERDICVRCGHVIERKDG